MLFDQTKLNIKFVFTNPEYISLGDPDRMKITFTKTEAWMKPVDERLKSVPDYLSIEILLPPQTDFAFDLDVKQSIS